MSRKYKKGRVRPRDTEGAIFRPNAEGIAGDEPDHRQGTHLEREVEVYTIFGKHDFLDGDDNPCVADDGEDTLAEDRDIAYAKTVSVNGRPDSFHIRTDNQGKFFNPMDIYGNSNSHSKRIHHTGERAFQYREVGVEAFQAYLAFLATKQQMHLRVAERNS